MRIIIPSWVLLFLISCNGPKQEPTVISKHSNAFNTSVQNAMDQYHSLTEAFVNWDSNAVVAKSKEVQGRLDSIKLDELKPDVKQTANNSLDLAKKDLQQMAATSSIVDERHGLNSLTQNLYDFLRAVQYDEKKVYLNECPMAFNDTEPGDWLSTADSIRNPYMGLHHPHYGGAMIDCGSKKSTIDFVSTANQQKQNGQGPEDKNTGNEKKSKSE